MHQDVTTDAWWVGTPQLHPRLKLSSKSFYLCRAKSSYADCFSHIWIFWTSAGDWEPGKCRGRLWWARERGLFRV